MVCLDRPYQYKFFKGYLPQFFFWSILEYLDPYIVQIVPHCNSVSKILKNQKMYARTEYTANKVQSYLPKQCCKLNLYPLSLSI